MRNLKRALSLLLSSAMVLGMMVMGSSAASYTDVTSKENVEAIEVLKAVGVMTGDQNGNFNPNKQVTRAEMAVVMANLLDLKVEDFKGASLPFTDVPEWAVPYVAACYADGITAGISATEYGSNNSVTTAQAALMMMKALGYFQNASDFGSDWQVATVKQGSTINLFDGIEAGASTAMTRNDVAQIALNTLEATMVETDGTNTTITTGDITINTGDTKYVEVAKAGTKYNAIDSANNGSGKNYVQLGEELFDGDLKKISGTTDAMGRPATGWTYKSSSVGTYAEAPDYTAYVTSSNNTLAKVVDSISKKFDESGATKALNGATNTLSPLSIGDYVEIYMDADDAEAIEYIAVTHKSVAKLTGDAATKESDDETLVKVPGISGLNTFVTANTTETVNGYAGLVEDDIVLYYQDNENNWYLEKAESFTGTLTAATTTKYTIDGTKYDKSGVTNVLSGITVTNFVKEPATWYTDNDGNIVWVEGVESTELAYVIAVKAGTPDWGTGSASTSDSKALLLLPDNTVKTVVYENASSFTAAEDTFVKYSVDSDNVYTLSSAGNYSSGVAGAVTNAKNGTSAFAFTKGNPNFTLNGTPYVANSETVYFVRDWNSTTSQVKDTYTMYTGYANVPTIASTTIAASNDNKSAVAYIGADGYADYVVIDTMSNISGTTTASDMFYVVDATVTTLYNADGAYGYTIKAIKNGGNEVIDLEFKTSPSSVTAGSAYVISSYNTDGQITAFGDAASSQSAGTAISNGQDVYIVGSDGTGKATNGTFKLGSAAYGYTSDTVVYYVDKDNNLTVMSVEDLDNDANDTYVAIRGSKTATDADYNTIVALFVTQVPTDVTAGSISTNLSSTDTATAGTPKPFTVAVTGQAPSATVSYTWKVNGAVVGGNSATLNYTFATAGSYTVDCVITVTDNTVDGTQVATLNATQCTVTVSAAPLLFLLHPNG